MEPKIQNVFLSNPSLPITILNVKLVTCHLSLDFCKKKWFVVTVDHNKGFIILTFCIPSSDFEVKEDCLGSKSTLKSICLFVFT